MISTLSSRNTIDLNKHSITQLTKSQLLTVSAPFDAIMPKLVFLAESYACDDKYLDHVITQHTAEPTSMFEERRAEAVTIPLTKSIVNTISNFMHQKPVRREVPELAAIEEFSYFLQDCTRAGESFEAFLTKAGRLASLFGCCGVLVSRPALETQTRADDIRLGIYPYLTMYSPINILERRLERDFKTGRMVTTLLRLRDSDRYIHVITRTDWAIYEITSSVLNQDAKLLSSGKMPAELNNEIPFTMLYNNKNLLNSELGESDVEAVAATQASITRFLSDASEIIKRTASPILALPRTDDDDYNENDTAGAESEIEIVTAPGIVIEYSAETPNAKPEWITTECESSLAAIREHIDFLIKQIYTTSHLSGIRGTAEMRQAKSGAALNTEFRDLASVLLAKSEEMSAAEREILRFWSLWARVPVSDMNIRVYRDTDFSLDDFTKTLDQLITSMAVVASETFRTRIQSRIIRRTAPDLSQSDLATIEEEIQESAAQSFNAADLVNAAIYDASEAEAKIAAELNGVPSGTNSETTDNSGDADGSN